MDYIRELRRMVGHFPIILTGAAVLILNERDELLMLLRTDNGCWGVPGGAMEPGERLEETAARETLEEAGLHIHGPALFGVFSGPELFYQYPNGDMAYNVVAVYLTRQASGDIAIHPDEHTGWKYFSLDHLPENISPPIRPILVKFLAGYRKPGPPFSPVY